MVVPTPRNRHGVPVRSTGASEAIQHLGPVVTALQQAGLVVDCTIEGLMHAPETPDILKSGARKTFRVEYHRGHFKNPMTDVELEEKFRLMAEKYLPSDRVDNLLRLLRGIENEPQASALIKATLV